MKENKIKLFAPVDGKVHSIEKLNDGVFSEKMLGDGLYIIPSGKDFYAPVETGKLEMITDSKHAFYFSTLDDVKILMHIGLDTVKLNGEPFKVEAKVNDKILLKNKIVKVDLDAIEKENISTATPIVLDTNDSPGWSFKILKEGAEAKKGDLIGEWNYTKPVNQNYEDEFDFLKEKGRYEKIAEEIYYAISGKENYTEVFSCMTRLRFEIKNTEKVDIEKIKHIPIVKGINWQGSQLQIIIGGEVYKVLDAVKVFVSNLNYDQNNQPIIIKRSFAKRLTAAVTGVIMPTIPLLLASGLLMGIKAILVMSNVIVDMGIGAGPINTNVDSFSLFFNLLAESGLKLFGIYIGYNTCKYLGGNTLLQLFIGLAIAGATLGMSTTQWDLFTIGNFHMKVGIYTSSILPHIAAAIILFHIEKWIKSWMPTAIDIIFRPLLTMTITFAAVFFVVGPILFLLESGIGFVIGKIALIPFGIGTAVFAFIWQPLILTGMHVTVVMPIAVTNAQGFHSTLLIAMNIATFAQMGATIGVCVRTKNSQLRTAGLSALPGALVGITEPVIYGVNLPKFRPFLAGVCAAGIAGLLSGLLAVEARLPGGMGVFGFTTTLGDPRLVAETIGGILVDPSSHNVFTGAANSAVLNLVLWFIVNGAGLVLGIVFTLLVYKERISENKEIIKTNNKLVKYYSKALNTNSSLAKKDLENNLNKLSSYIKAEDLLKIKNLELQLVKLSKIEGKAESLLQKQEKSKEALIKKLKVLVNKPEEKQNKTLIEKLKQNYLKIKNSDEVNKLFSEAQIIREQIEVEMSWLTNWQKDFMNLIDSTLDEVVLKTKYQDMKKISSNYFNAIHSLDINYLITEKDENNFDKKEFKKYQKNLAITN
ncbi:glucose PTS transporter subunit IIA [Spiroplasma alleghenense]|uniref:PTS system beta-glucoside-specific IIABC component n=1 Tax=Spiroplasma alleghenense TaxID=216931 RepID=A0A345Z4M1_9MOLU|nr:glucose PTS transporter subunit IIA [Spiroplasma alleghenense]AXK51550.1 PTS system beta-glucoside-specific IIABC component [Spiroplasma alleghenense]